MCRRPFLLMSALLLGCGDRAAPEPAARPPAPPATAPTAVPGDTLDRALLARGRGVHDAVCSECHSIDPPPRTAPTLREIVDRYHEAFLDPAQALDHLASYIREPAAPSSLLSQMMIDEWGVMPPQPLPAEDLAAVAYFIWHLPQDTTSAATGTTRDIP